MARKPKKAGGGNGTSKKAAEGAAAAAPELGDAKFGVLVQFVKDLSFESPNAPVALQSPGENPKLEVNVQVQAIRHSDEYYEVDLQLEAKAQSDLGVIYNIEVVYGGMFQAVNIPEQYLTPVLFVDAPTIMFPYLRRVVSDTTRDGGFQPLMLDPIDFARLYQESSQNANIQNLQAAAP